jgi:hypothetical protein
MKGKGAVLGGPRYFGGGPTFCARTTPACPGMGEGRFSLLADDRNALANVNSRRDLFSRQVRSQVLAPKVLKAAWRELGVPHRGLDTAMPKVSLQRTRVGTLARQNKACRMPQHVWVHLEADLGRVAGALDQLGEPSDSEGV